MEVINSIEGDKRKIKLDPWKKTTQRINSLSHQKRKYPEVKVAKYMHSL